MFSSQGDVGECCGQTKQVSVRIVGFFSGEWVFFQHTPKLTLDGTKMEIQSKDGDSFSSNQIRGVLRKVNGVLISSNISRGDGCICECLCVQACVQACVHVFVCWGDYCTSLRDRQANFYDF